MRKLRSDWLNHLPRPHSWEAINSSPFPRLTPPEQSTGLRNTRPGSAISFVHFLCLSLISLFFTLSFLYPIFCSSGCRSPDREEKKLALQGKAGIALYVLVAKAITSRKVGLEHSYCWTGSNLLCLTWTQLINLSSVSSHLFNLHKPLRAHGGVCLREGGGVEGQEMERANEKQELKSTV